VVLSAEQRARHRSTVLTQAVARYLYKLMAYKDEYEVARLIVDEDFAAKVKGEFGESSTLAFRLHPPMLRSMGMTQKMSFGPRSLPIFRVLHAMRRVRGTAWDPFGYRAIRRLERELITEYVGAFRLVAARSDRRQSGRGHRDRRAARHGPRLRARQDRQRPALSAATG
jgi:indolepyruvate ferredoxin oxidoreductase